MNRKMGKMMVKALSEEMVRPAIQGRGGDREDRYHSDRCEHGCLGGHCLDNMPEGSIKYGNEGHMGGEITQPRTWQQDTVIQMD